jgi:hypothetical protein
MSRVYISRDVVFDETAFPFSTLHPNVGARLRSEISLLPPSLIDPVLIRGSTCLSLLTPLCSNVPYQNFQVQQRRWTDLSLLLGTLIF